jgi:hypothetical protein
LRALTNFWFIIPNVASNYFYHRWTFESTQLTDSLLTDLLIMLKRKSGDNFYGKLWGLIRAEKVMENKVFVVEIRGLNVRVYKYERNSYCF